MPALKALNELALLLLDPCPKPQACDYPGTGGQASNNPQHLRWVRKIGRAKPGEKSTNGLGEQFHRHRTRDVPTAAVCHQRPGNVIGLDER